VSDPPVDIQCWDMSQWVPSGQVGRSRASVVCALWSCMSKRPSALFRVTIHNFNFFPYARVYDTTYPSISVKATSKSYHIFVYKCHTRSRKVSFNNGQIYLQKLNYKLHSKFQYPS
jgi:hypothetical protein